MASKGLRVDKAQTLTAGEKLRAQENIGLPLPEVPAEPLTNEEIWEIYFPRLGVRLEPPYLIFPGLTTGAPEIKVLTS